MISCQNYFSKFFHLLVFPLLVTVAEECSEEAGIEMVENHTKQVLVELEGVGELLHDLWENQINILVIRDRQLEDNKKVQPARRSR